MRQVALISQTMRAGHCHAYMSAEDGDTVILTSNPSAFADFDLGGRTRLIPINPPPELLPPANLARTRLFRSILARARSGSRFGRWLERSAKKVARRIRPLDRSGEQEAPRQTLELDSVRASDIYQRLMEEHGKSTIDRLVVFDVFDLPVALVFADDHNVDVVVR
jgi:hypothetical protein